MDWKTSEEAPTAKNEQPRARRLFKMIETNSTAFSKATFIAASENLDLSKQISFFAQNITEI